MRDRPVVPTLALRLTLFTLFTLMLASASVLAFNPQPDPPGQQRAVLINDDLGVIYVRSGLQAHITFRAEGPEESRFIGGPGDGAIGGPGDGAIGGPGDGQIGGPGDGEIGGPGDGAIGGPGDGAIGGPGDEGPEEGPGDEGPEERCGVEIILFDESGDIVASQAAILGPGRVTTLLFSPDTGQRVHARVVGTEVSQVFDGDIRFHPQPADACRAGRSTLELVDAASGATLLALPPPVNDKLRKQVRVLPSVGVVVGQFVEVAFTPDWIGSSLNFNHGRKNGSLARCGVRVDIVDEDGNRLASETSVVTVGGVGSATFEWSGPGDEGPEEAPGDEGPEELPPPVSDRLRISARTTGVGGFLLTDVGGRTRRQLPYDPCKGGHATLQVIDVATETTTVILRD